MNRYCLLSTAYWPPVQYFTKLLFFDKIIIEIFETYPKQSYRNRMEIYGANGIQTLQIPVVKASFKKQVLKEVEIAYDTLWQKNHFKTIESAYRSSPFYEYYIDDILPFYTKQFKYLIDYNQSILELSLNLIGIHTEITSTTNFSLNKEVNDFRNSIHPKKKMQKVDNTFAPKFYLQGFEQRHGFVPNLSILDLIFNTGPEARDILKTSIVP